MNPGINLDQVLDALADRVAARFRNGVPASDVGTVRPRLLGIDRTRDHVSGGEDS
jgi:hypothetical protein